ncbi:hypothetical protein JHK82_019007 [Glycine max]|nr:hypothetical protein JHK82_019007 [Glycine max]
MVHDIFVKVKLEVTRTSTILNMFGSRRSSDVTRFIFCPNFARRGKRKDEQHENKWYAILQIKKCWTIKRSFDFERRETLRRNWRVEERPDIYATSIIMQRLKTLSSSKCKSGAHSASLTDFCGVRAGNTSNSKPLKTITILYTTLIVNFDYTKLARMSYRMFAKTWPQRSRRLFSSFDHAIQRWDPWGVPDDYRCEVIENDAPVPKHVPLLIEFDKTLEAL